MNYLKLLIFFSFISCNAFELIDNSKSSIDKNFGNNLSIEDLAGEIVGFWPFSDTSLNKHEAFGSVALTLIDNATVAPAIISGVRDNAIDCSSAVFTSVPPLATTLNLGKSTEGSYSFSVWLNMGANPTGATIHTFLSIGSLVFNIADNGGNQFADLALSFNGYIFSVSDFYDFDNNSWVHIALTVEGDEVGGTQNQMTKLYLNGQLAHSDNTASNDNFNGTLGVCSDSAGNNKYNGAIDSLGLWSRVLTQDEITFLYQNG